MATPEKQIASSPNFAVNLEALRGFAASIVIFTHAVGHRFSLDPAYQPALEWQTVLPGHAVVLIFFLLSGYVIGLTNPRPLTRADILPYLRKRFVRLYPIYLIGVLLALLVAAKSYSLLTVAGHFLFLQNLKVPLIWENNPLWSLTYEVLFYLAFIPLSYLRITPGRVVVVTALVGLLCSSVVPLPVLGSYALGFLFWSLGWWLTSVRFPPKPASRAELGALLLVFMAYPILNFFLLGPLLLRTKLHVPFVESNGVNVTIDDLMQLPLCLYLVLRFTNQTIRFAPLLLAGIIGSGFLSISYTVYRYGIASSKVSYCILAVVVLTLGMLALMLRVRSGAGSKPILPGWLLKVGSMSYAMYAIHFPISLLLSRVGAFSGTAITFVVRLLMELALVLGISYLLELKLQPWLKARLMPLTR